MVEDERFLGLGVFYPSISRFFIQDFLELWLLKGLVFKPILSLMIYCLKLFEFKVLCVSFRFLGLKVWGLKVLNLESRCLED